VTTEDMVLVVIAVVVVVLIAVLAQALWG